MSATRVRNSSTFLKAAVPYLVGLGVRVRVGVGARVRVGVGARVSMAVPCCFCSCPLETRHTEG